MESNHDKFNYYVGSIFAFLLESFPRRTQLKFVSLAGAKECDETVNEHGRHTRMYLRNGVIEDLTDELEFIYETAHWLFQTGYLIGSVGRTQLGRSAFVTLSPKALEILKVVPASVHSKAESKSIGQEITDAVKSSAKKKVGELASEALTYAVKLGWAAVIQP